MVDVTLTVLGMSCSSCANRIASALKDIGAESAADVEAGTVHIRYDEERCGAESIVKAIEAKGYKVLR